MNHRLTLASASLLAMAACTAPQTSALLQSNGVSQPAADKVGTIWSTAVNDATLFCLINSTVAAVPGVLVKGATAASVANACAKAQLIGGIVAATVPVPVPPPAVPAAVPVAVTTPIAAAAVAASVKPAS